MLKRFFRWITIAFSPEKALYFDLKRIFGEYPNNLSFYKTAFIHRSASEQHADGTVKNNERLEYLGDAVLSTVVADYLFSRYPQYKEGQLTQIRSKIVNHSTLNEIAHKLDFAKYIVSQSNVQCSGKYFYGDMVEALIGALFLDKGFDKTKAIVLNRLLNGFLDIDNLVKIEVDFKSRIIEWCQKNKHTINFDCHVKKACPNVFCADVSINSETAANGTGASKKEAEQNAARVIWEKYVSVDNAAE